MTTRPAARHTPCTRRAARRWSQCRNQRLLASRPLYVVDAQVLDLNHIEFTPIFAHWLCADCNRQLQSLLDVLPASQIKPYLLRLFAMGRAVQGGVTSRRDEPETESDGYDASLEAMFEGLS